MLLGSISVSKLALPENAPSTLEIEASGAAAAVSPSHHYQTGRSCAEPPKRTGEKSPGSGNYGIPGGAGGGRSSHRGYLRRIWIQPQLFKPGIPGGNRANSGGLCHRNEGGQSQAADSGDEHELCPDIRPSFL